MALYSEVEEVIRYKLEEHIHTSYMILSWWLRACVFRSLLHLDSRKHNILLFNFTLQKLYTQAGHMLREGCCKRVHALVSIVNIRLLKAASDYNLSPMKLAGLNDECLACKILSICFIP